VQASIICTPGSITVQLIWHFIHLAYDPENNMNNCKVGIQTFKHRPKLNCRNTIVELSKGSENHRVKTTRKLWIAGYIAVILHQQDGKRCWNEGSDYCGIPPKLKRKEPYLVKFF